MRFSVKLIACLALVLVIGFSAAYALLFTTETRPKPQFDVDAVYAYVGPGTGNASSHSHFGMQVYPVTLYPCVVYFNFTHLSSAEAESCDFKFEVYLIQMSSDKGSAENYTYFQGTNYSPFSDLDEIPMPSNLMDMTMSVPHVSEGGGFSPNWTAHASYVFRGVYTGGSFSSSGGSNLGLWSAGQPDAIFLSVRRLGWISVNGNSTSTTLASAENIVQVQLEKFGDGFLYNKIVPEDKLSQIDPLNPPI